MVEFDLTIKTLNQKKFTLKVDNDDTVLTVKEKIEKTQTFPVDSQKLIFSGKVLENDKKLEDLKITEKDFFVLMTTKPKKTITSTSTGESNTGTFSDIKATEEKSTVPVPVSSVTSTENTAISNTGDDAIDSGSQLVTGNQLDSVIQNMIEMGFERDQCVRALRASYNNPDRAVEYLFNGIPQNIQDEMSAPQQQETQPSPDSTNTPRNLFTAAAQHAQTSNLDINTFRNTHQFRQIRQLVRDNPAALQTVLQELERSNPEILETINQNPQTFIQALSEYSDDEEDDETGVPPPGSSMIQVTQEEKEAIDRLTALGFSRSAAVEAYFACDKNEELAANYLFDHGNEDI